MSGSSRNLLPPARQGLALHHLQNGVTAAWLKANFSDNGQHTVFFFLWASQTI
ncbi:hypothetical protein EaACW_0461 [Erwinia amylovora ACW56400]|uniref:Uncharacterized protein n=1 Tax=Erwinia amylovora NBRC 12687 = CFBP 1232 TaxID=1219359 RepID=A0A830ZYI1_ERWAM|nr:hypothetical protein EaACW_0461 [Erwinia amylovora ACW56400]CCO77305.1 hypothetical protein BN432_0473 [Erwinia amylovora Ea356]CCO81089.1 hypothetical protein BN433_0483 [Erwinia amylovora Ea266]CCO84894.1 hypothetical protein BN434_0472 [Erwinia amylovora CFBP 2585]CCO88680.1 hypothetical protein BN435_0473 [Erwinia amylovora 01SFR-BO]CCO92437.1 hypothetical protein BN437_0472 [Erwinia amylovora NBRC 12687 = CFBP 1232]CCO97790.1 hypothetical protein BN438_0473 [Erwinia amylovora UPN527]